MHIYSPFFQTLYDEQEPVGYLGRGTHYSILRAIVFHDEYGQPLPQDRYKCPEAKYHDFAVLWDEDHDTRIIEALQKIYTRGILPMFSFLGERKAMLTALALSDSQVLRSYAPSILKEICSNIYNDCWTSEVGIISQPEAIINAATQDIVLYLKNINMLWKLGSKPITYSIPPQD
jgi:hypothetical protein